MKRVGIILCAAVFVAAIPTSHYVLANGNANLVSICHFPDGAEVGNVIEVSGNGSSVEKHVTLHGDGTDYLLAKGGGCVVEKKEKCTKEQESKCAKLGGVLDPKTCECLVKQPPKECSKEDAVNCANKGGVLDENCKCIVKQPPKECSKEDAALCAKKGGVLDANCKCIVKEEPPKEEEEEQK